MSLPILPTISTAFIVLSAITVAIGWYQIKQRKFETHQKTMTWAAVFAAIFFVIYLSRTVFIGNTSFGGPESLKLYYTIFLIFHITLATVGAVLGITMLVTGYKKNFTYHRKMRSYNKYHLVFYSDYRCSCLLTFICFFPWWRNCIRI